MIQVTCNLSLYHFINGFEEDELYPPAVISKFFHDDDIEVREANYLYMLDSEEEN